MGYSSRAVGNYFIERYGQKNAISPLKLQKLVYVSHGWHLALYNEPLVTDEHPEAWTFGPVFPSLYHAFKHHGALPILKPASEYEMPKDDSPKRESGFAHFLPGKLRTVIPRVDEEDEDTIRLLDRIWVVYGGYSGAELSAMTHKRGSPWDETRNGDGIRNNANIQDGLIERHFKSLMLEDGNG